MSNPMDNKAGISEAKADEAHIDHAYDVEAKKEMNVDMQGAIDAENQEFEMTVLQAVRAYPAASLWAFNMSCTIIMEAYCVFLIGNFIALPAFANRYGIWSAEKDKNVIETSWQSALQVGGPIGAIIGVTIAGPITSKIGYRWATISGLMLLNCFIFIFYFADSLALMLVAQLLEGIPWGIFIANSPAYCSEIVPLRLRAPATQMLQMFWAIGAIIVGAVAYHYNELDEQAAFRVPIALQWMFPTPLAILIFLSPSLPGGSQVDNAHEAIAMMKRTIDLEKTIKEPSLLELFRGTDLYRTLIVCGVYAAQNLTGNLIANQAVYFFEQAGMPTKTAFAMGLITSALQTVFVMLSWILTSYFGRRSIYLWGSAGNTVLLVALGIAATVGDVKSVLNSNTQAALGLIVSVLFTLGPAPASWVIIGETSSIRLRPLTTGVGRGCYYLVNIPCIFLSSWMLNPTGANLGGKCGYVWAGTGAFCLLCAYIWLPEMKDRSYREIDILFNRKVPARQWKKTVVDIHDNE
ncbi:Alpha-glucosides permease MPH3 [Fusarium culmorum]|uniref:Alpha-glucosides permease MPH3 n=1 Tax=Fusarium culmorum TaxID=5516 RepID=A0A2T4GST5_FUSCU|nr:Alpha-glucosides permease MPH3 [Fusarium culmorum]